MRPWTIDADDIQIADDFDAALLHKTVWIENFLDANRDDKFIVVGTKGFGKTLLLKAKRIRCQELGYLCLPHDALLDKPVGNKIFSRELLGIYEADIEPWSRVWITSIACAVLKNSGLPETLDVSPRFIALLRNTQLRSVFDHFVVLLDYSPRDVHRCAQETNTVLIPLLRALKRPVAVFIDSVDEYFNKHIHTPGVARELFRRTVARHLVPVADVAGGSRLPAATHHQASESVRIGAQGSVQPPRRVEPDGAAVSRQRDRRVL